MALKTILERFCRKTGVASSDTAERAVAIQFINEACAELWTATDLAGCLRECVLQVNGNYEIALPAFIGKVRAVREFDSKYPWTIQDVRPRYHTYSWVHEWTGWRDKGKRALCKDITSITPLHFSVNTVEVPAISVYIVGKTADANSVAEELELSATTNETANQFEEIESITKLEKNTQDVTITDDDGNVLAVLYNNMLTTAYTVLDISDFPFTIPPQTAESLCMEVLFKPVLPRLYYDSDTFPVEGYDNIIVGKAMQLYYEEMPGSEERAQIWGQKAESIAARVHKDTLGGKTMRFEFQRHPHDNLFFNEQSRPTHKAV